MMLSASCSLDAWGDLLAFRAPYLDERLVKERIAGTPDEAAALFDEAKKYLVVATLHEELRVPMLSRRVDEAWRQFILYTKEYAAFCQRFFAGYVDHAPALGDGEAPGDRRPRMAREAFERAYESLFGALSPLWDDARWVALDSRVLRAGIGRGLAARAWEGKAELVIDREPSFTLARSDARALAAFTFVARVETFCPRELPGLDDEARVALVKVLLAAGVLEVAP